MNPRPPDVTRTTTLVPHATLLRIERNGTTLLARAPVSFTTAALGGTIEVPGIDRKPCEIQIRPGVQHGNQIRLRGRGMPALNGRGIGDLVEIGRAHV